MPVLVVWKIRLSGGIKGELLKKFFFDERVGKTSGAQAPGDG